MESASAQQASFSLAEVRGILKDLFTPRPWIYWTDFLAAMTLGAASFLLVSPAAAAGIFAQVALYLASCVLFYRATLFTHELVHMRAGTFRAFRVTWNLLCGIPFLIPTFTYYTHVDHHMRSHFGTHRDGEYIPFGLRRPSSILLYLLQPFVLPPLAVFRFLVLTPLCWLLPAVRRWVRRASSMVMEPTYIRPTPTPKTLRIFRVQETACFLLLLGGAVGFFLRGWPNLGFIAQCYGTGVGVLLLNNLRTLGAHRYVSGGREMTFVEQLLDSLSYPDFSLLTPLWAPVGLRYHALHHLCPSLPYHNMREAHRRLMERLPANSPYRQTTSPSLWRSIRELWLRSAAGADLAAIPGGSPDQGGSGGSRGSMAMNA